jgi:uncharacterized protein YkwD
MRRGLAGFIAACSLAVTLATVSGPAPVMATARERAQMIAWVNNVREAHGVKPLHATWKLWKLARQHSLKMADDGDLYHSSNLSAKLSFANWSTYGENVGVGMEARDLYEAFMRSDGHRHNILDRRFHKVGVGFARDERGVLWVTMIFYG